MAVVVSVLWFCSACVVVVVRLVCGGCGGVVARPVTLARLYDGSRWRPVRHPSGEHISILVKKSTDNFFRNFSLEDFPLRNHFLAQFCPTFFQT